MTDSPFLDPNDPHYSDTPSVDEHPLEGDGTYAITLNRRTPSEQAAWHEGFIYGVKMSQPADGYLLVSEAELAEALRTALPPNAYRGSWHSNHQTMQPMGWDEDDAVARIAEDAFAALAKQQEARER